MRVLVVGGGPGGLYAALLLKKVRPDADVEVIDRNPPDATYGWGVVFSEQTLGRLEEADGESYREIVDAFADWDAIDVHLGGERIRAYGHGFAGLSRKILLGILQNRCSALGVTLTFEREVDDLSVFPDYHLVIAADGVNSVVRRSHEQHFKPSYDVRTARFVWYGTTKRPEAFTYMVKATEFGTFQATMYPFADELSTFIVECSGQTFANAGLEAMSEEDSARFAEQLFAELLDGHPLLLNRSLWLNFTTVRNATWHRENIVLLGDAAHTAHFSIGSGTKLAMEDAIDLVDGIRRFDALHDAIVFYERGREPIVEAIQEAAQQSLEWFEALDRSLHLDPLQFMFNFLTRSGRISYDNVRERDPRYADRFDRFYAGQDRGSDDEQLLLAPPPLFTPVRLAQTWMVNRAALALPSDLPTADGVPGDAHVLATRWRAHAGVSTLFTDVIAVEPRGRVTPLDAGLYTEEQRDGWSDVVAAAHSAPATRIFARIGHAGPRGATKPRTRGLDRPLADGWELLAASAQPYGPRSAVPRAASGDDLDTIVTAFEDASRRALECGFDGLELHAGHGYLLAAFLSPLTNLRDDEYGGDLICRLRLPLRVLGAVRGIWPEDRPLSVCVNADDCAVGGAGADEAVEVVHAMREQGADLVHLVAGQTTPRSRPSYERSFLAPYGERIRAETGVAVIIRGRITSSDGANTVLAGGRADLCIVDLDGMNTRDRAIVESPHARERSIRRTRTHEAVA